MFDTKIAFVVRDDLAVWQRLNVVAFLATGVATMVPDIIGEPYVDALGRHYGSMSGQPMLIFASDLDGLQRTHQKGLERDLILIPYVQAMFSTGHDSANREVFLAEDAHRLNLVGLALQAPKRQSTKRSRAYIYISNAIE